VAHAVSAFRTSLHDALARLEAAPVEHWWQHDVLVAFQRRPRAVVVDLAKVSEEPIERAHDRIALAVRSGGIDGTERARVVAWLRTLEQPDGGYAAPERASDEMLAAWRLAVPSMEPPSPLGPYSSVRDACWAIAALRELGEAPPSRAADWLRDRQREDGAFRAALSIDAHGEIVNDDLADSAAALEALASLSTRPRDEEACVAWLVAQVDRSWLTDLVQLHRLVSALSRLGALGRLRVDVPKILATHHLEPTFELYAATQIVQLLDLERSAS
jgi:hypothetical protein